MKKQIIEKVIFFTLCLGSNLISTVWANADTKSVVNSDSISVSSGEIKNIVNNDVNIIDTTIQDEYGLSSNDGGILNINVDSLEIDHNIDKSNEFIGINAKGKDVQGNISSIDIATVNDINININAKEFGQISGLDIKDNAKLQMKAQDGDVNLKINMSIDRTLFDTHNSVISLQNNAEMSLSGNNIDIISTIDATSRQRSFNNYGLDIDNSKLDIQSKGNININTIATGNGFNNYGIHIQDIGNNSSNVNIISGGNLYLNSMDNGMNNESYGIYVENIDNSQTNTHLVINSNNNIINTKTTGIEAIGVSSVVDLVAKKGSNVIKAIGDYDSTGIEANNNADINLVASENNIISADYTGIHVSYADEHHNNISLKAKNNVISSVETAILSFEKGNIKLEAIGGNNQINSNYLGISLMENSFLNMNAQQGLNLFEVNNGIDLLVSNSHLILNANGNILQGIEGIANINQGNINLGANTKGNIIKAKEFGIYTKENSTTFLNTKNSNNMILVEKGIGISGNQSTIKINNVGGNNIINVNDGIAIEANNSVNIDLDTTKGKNILISNKDVISLNNYHIDENLNNSIIGLTKVNLQSQNNILQGNIVINSIKGNTNIIAKDNDNILNAKKTVIYSQDGSNVNILSNKGNNVLKSQNDITVNLNNSNLNLEAQNNEIIQLNKLDAISAINSQIEINATNNNEIQGNISLLDNSNLNILGGNNSLLGSISINDSTAQIVAKEQNNQIDIEDKSLSIVNSNIDISANEDNILFGNENFLEANNSQIKLNANDNILMTEKQNNLLLNLKQSILNLEGNNSNSLQGNILSNNSTIIIEGNKNNIYANMNIVDSKVIIQAKTNNNLLLNEHYLNNSEETILAKQDNIWISEKDNLIRLDNSKMNLSANNNLLVGKANNVINLNDGQINISSVKNNNIQGNIISRNGNINLEANDKNFINGNIYATNKRSNIFIKSNKNSGTNYFISSYNLKTQDGNTINNIIWAQDESNINLEANLNYFESKSNIPVITLWSNGGTINLLGTTIIETNNLNDIALLADEYNGNRGEINLNLRKQSKIIGNIVADKNSIINIKSLNKWENNINVQGNILAKNNANIIIDLSDNSKITGNINDYNYNKYIKNNEIEKQGYIKIDLDKLSRWNVIGQSFVSEISTKDNVIIDLVGSNDKENAHSIMVNKFDGNATFAMNLSGDRSKSDMLYFNQMEGSYDVILSNILTSEDLGKNGLRFATVGQGKNNIFKHVVVYDEGAFNIEYKIADENYDLNNIENKLYNNDNATNNNELGDYKPGNDIIEKLVENNNGNVKNYKIINPDKIMLSDAGKTILNMTKANYDMAVFMGRLDKRLGDIHYLQDNDGLWFRMRHDRIDKDLMFTIDSNMYELGYDKLTRQEDGQTRWGVALDYMQGSTIYDDIIGKGESDRRGLWLYNTWLGDDGHYSDYILKWGHLENDFAIYSGNKLDLITGKYDNNVYSASAEYGYKQDLGNNWFITPQAQIQLAKISGADYMTSQDTAVSVDGINSLIARLGFKIGKDFKDKSNFYLKADIIHEFWGEQFVSVKDKSSDDRVIGFNYDHSGTWYDIGLGFNIMTTDNSYVYMDYEKRFGNGNRNSYQINGGINWLF